MIIKLNKSADCIKFYDELFYITQFYKTILKNPRVKVTLLSEYILKRIFLVTLLFACVIIFIIFFGFNIFILIGLIMEIIIFLSYLILYINNKKRLNMYTKDTSEPKLEINGEYVMIIRKESEEVKLYWEVIDKIIINKYSIVFFPKDLKLVVLGFEIVDKDIIVSTIKKYNHDDLIVDNTNLYEG